MNFRKSLSVYLFFVLSSVVFVGNAFSQGRERIVQLPPNQQLASLHKNPENTDLLENYQRQKPTTIQKTVIVPDYQSLIKKTASSQQTSPIAYNYISKNSYSTIFSQRLLNAIESKIGTPYLYGSSGPNRYDCSGLVWSAFQDAGFYFERTSARTIWQNSEPVEGDDRYKLGTLVFFKNLGHIGIVADADGFYHASTSHGVMYSRFDGYWKNKIVGFRRMRVNDLVAQIK